MYKARLSALYMASRRPPKNIKDGVRKPYFT